MPKKWIFPILAAALLALPGVGVNQAQPYTGWAPAQDVAPLHPACYAASGTKCTYLAGDLHNHTPFSDGTAGVPLLVGKALQNLDWFAQSGHGGKYARDGRYNDPEADGSLSGEGKFLDDTVGAASFQGDADPQGNPLSDTLLMKKFSITTIPLWLTMWRPGLTCGFTPTPFLSG